MDPIERGALVERGALAERDRPNEREAFFFIVAKMLSVAGHWHDHITIAILSGQKRRSL